MGEAWLESVIFARQAAASLRSSRHQPFPLVCFDCDLEWVWEMFIHLFPGQLWLSGLRDFPKDRTGSLTVHVDLSQQCSKGCLPIVSRCKRSRVVSVCAVRRLLDDLKPMWDWWLHLSPVSLCVVPFVSLLDLLVK